VESAVANHLRCDSLEQGEQHTTVTYEKNMTTLFAKIYCRVRLTFTAKLSLIVSQYLQGLLKVTMSSH
jgi:hypothetical protein